MAIVTEHVCTGSTGIKMNSGSIFYSKHKRTQKLCIKKSTLITFMLIIFKFIQAAFE